MIAKLRHKVTLCSQKDVVDGTDLKVPQYAVKTAWAMIKAVSSNPFSNKGANTDSRNKATHKIMIRYDWRLEISNLAWLHEARLKSPARWFKILKVTETEEKGSAFWTFEVMLTNKGDALDQPKTEAVTTVASLPHGVSL